jgi:hypothetical protein
MTRSVLPSLLGSEFDDFLFAPIGEERNGMLLSVVSALARLDIDPWQETAQLAQLPAAAATQRLASFIAAIPDRPAHQDPRTIAAGLIALLPRRADPNVMSWQKSLGVGAVTDPHSVNYSIVINVIFWAFVTAALGILASNQAPAPVDTHVAASSQVVPPAPPPNSGQ